MGGKYYYASEESIDYEKAAEHYEQAAKYENADGN